MRGGKSAIICGIIVFVFGVIFHLQGNSVIGPQSSFMYANPQWIDYGLFIAISGIIVIGVGIGLFLKKSNKQLSK